MKNIRDLPVPEVVTADAKAMEVFRAWVAEGGLICAVRPTTWNDSSAWGIVLADAARHVANALKEEIGEEPSATVAKIREMFNRELDKATDEPTGTIVK